MASRLLLPALGACLLFSACGSSGSGPAAVGGVALANVTGGDVPVEFVLVDGESDPVDVELLYTVDGGATWHPGTVRGSTTSLSSSPAGVRHVLVWDSVTDLGPRSNQEFQVSVRPIETVTRRTSAAVLATATLENVAPAARRVEAYMIYFGAVNAQEIAIAETHDLVILYTCDPSITRSVIAEIQNGIDPNDPSDDVMVLGYVNVGEDDRTIGISDNDLLLDSRFVGDASGPRLDPRGAGAAGQPLIGLDPLGLPSVSSGYASFYLDDNSLESDGIGDGKPDRNGVTGACYVNMGDPNWFLTLNDMRCDTDMRTGFREILSIDYGLGLGCDGVMLDNVDTCAPNGWTGPGDPDQAEFEWTTAGYSAFVSQLRTEYPQALIMQNRGLFFFNPDLPHYGLSPRADINFVKLESYRLDRETSHEFDPYFFADNKFNFGPKLQAEAYRSDGFQVLSLGYAEGPGIDHDTLLGLSTNGLTTLLEDIVEAQELAGYRHYLMDAGGQVCNPFCRDQADFTDTMPPVWTSTYNINNPGYPTPPTAPNARVGIQQVVPSVESVKVRWDVALDLNPVSYVLYYDELDFDFSANDPFRDAARMVLDPATGFAYELGAGSGIYPYEAVVTGLAKNSNYYFCIRAVDTAGNEDTNEVVLSVTTLNQDLAIAVDGNFGDWADLPVLVRDRRTKANSSGPNWKDIKVINDGTNLYVWLKTYARFNLDGSPGYTTSQLKILIDVDDDPFTGFRFSNIGSELMVHGDRLVAQAASTEDAGLVQMLSFNPTTNMKECELAVPLAQIDAAAGRIATTIRLIFRDADTGDLAPDSGYLEYVIAR